MTDASNSAAIEQARAAVHGDPFSSRAQRALGGLLRATGDTAEADRHEQRSIELGLAHPLVLQARHALTAGRNDDAARALLARLRDDPDDIVALHLLATIAERGRSIARAEALLRRATAIAPGYADARISLVVLLGRTNRVEEALAEVDAVLTRDPRHAAALAQKGALLVRARRHEAADAVLCALLQHHPDDWAGWLNHGHLLKTLGRIDEAITAYRRAIATAPATGIAWWALANTRAATFDANDVEAMRAALAGSSDDADRVHLHFALAHALGSVAQAAAAFEHLRAGNALRLAHAPHDADLFSANFRRSEALFSRSFLAARAEAGAPAADPIFIVGMPRSGSTLVEQILASHPQVEGTEELHDLNRVAKAMAAEVRGESYLDGIAGLPPTRLRAFGERYLEAARRYRRTDRPFFTDKMPSNWIYTGLLRLILPRARIVDVRRHPMACGFANYSQHFNWGNNFAYDQVAIGRFYADYVRHMAHFGRVAPGAIHRVHHESLVDDLEGEVRRLLSFLGLPFDPACLRFHETPRTVHTPSTEQVRRPINRDGIDRWRAYEPWLGPMQEALGPTLDHYPAVPPGW